MSCPVDALICGGGATGLWLRALLKDYGRSVVLIESEALGSGQTIASQGILHSGAKYAARTEEFGELLHVLPVMSFAWRQHLSGENLPDLRGTDVVTRESWYWTPANDLPGCLQRWQQAHDAATDVAPPLPILGPTAAAYRNSRECCVSPASLLQVLAGEDRSDLLQVPVGHIHWQLDAPGQVTSVSITHPDVDEALELQPRYVYLTAGAGNAALRTELGLPGEHLMQRRPLRIGLMRGNLPRFCGHWFDDNGPRLTVSTQFDDCGQAIWQLGGRLAEAPHDESPQEFLWRARQAVAAGLPALDLQSIEWSSYDAVRAEPVSTGGGLPSDVGIMSAGNVITLWPTKLTLLPYLMIDIRRALDVGGARPAAVPSLPDWPTPEVARPPWETQTPWTPDAQLAVR